MPSSKAEHFFLTLRSPVGPLLLPPPPSHTPSFHPAGQRSAPWAHQADGGGGVQRGLGWSLVFCTRADDGGGVQRGLGWSLVSRI